MRPTSDSGSLLVPTSGSFCRDTWGAGSALSCVACSDRVVTTSSEVPDTGNASAKNNDSYFNAVIQKVVLIS